MRTPEYTYLRCGWVAQSRVASTRIQTSEAREVRDLIHSPIIAAAASASGIAPQ
jgi:hypothetical protein